MRKSFRNMWISKSWRPSPGKRPKLQRPSTGQLCRPCRNVCCWHCILYVHNAGGSHENCGACLYDSILYLRLCQCSAFWGSVRKKGCRMTWKSEREEVKHLKKHVYAKLRPCAESGTYVRDPRDIPGVSAIFDLLPLRNRSVKVYSAILRENNPTQAGVWSALIAHTSAV